MSSPRRLKSPARGQTAELCPPPPWCPWGSTTALVLYSQAVSSSPESSRAVGLRVCSSICCWILATFSCHLLPGVGWEGFSTQPFPYWVEMCGRCTCELLWEAVDVAGRWRGPLVAPHLVHKVGLHGQQGDAGTLQGLLVAVPRVCRESGPRGCITQRPPYGAAPPRCQPTLPIEKRKGSRLTFPPAGTTSMIHVPMDSIQAARQSCVSGFWQGAAPHPHPLH